MERKASENPEQFLNELEIDPNNLDLEHPSTQYELTDFLKNKDFEN